MLILGCIEKLDVTLNLLSYVREFKKEKIN